MTKEELSQLYYLNREIEQIQRRLQELDCLSTSCTANITGMPRSFDISDKVGSYAIEIAELKCLLEINLKRCFLELNRLNRYIQSIDNSEMRQILALRYVNGLSWQQIAFNLGIHDESVPRQKHNRFLRNDERN